MKMQRKGGDFPGHVQVKDRVSIIHEMQYTMKQTRYTV